MEIRFDSSKLKSPLGILVVVMVVVVAAGYMHWRRSALIEQGRVQVVEYLSSELPARYLRQLDEPTPDPERIEQLGQVEVVEFSPSWFFRADRDDRVRVKTVVRLGTGETGTFYFRFRRVLGRWQLQSETREPLLEIFR